VILDLRENQLKRLHVEGKDGYPSLQGGKGSRKRKKRRGQEWDLFLGEPTGFYQFGSEDKSSGVFRRDKEKVISRGGGEGNRTTPLGPNIKSALVQMEKESEEVEVSVSDRCTRGKKDSRVRIS